MRTDLPRLAMRLGVAFMSYVLLTATASAAPAEPKPVISSNTKSADISVTIDPALKAAPSLYENLLAEAQRQVAKVRAEADKALRAHDFPFKIGGKYEFSRSYTQRSSIGRYVSIVRDDGSFQGGAHPNQSIDTILWDKDAKKQISIRGFFKETADKGPTMTAMAKLVRAAVNAEKKKRDRPVGDNPDTDEWLKDITPSLLKLGPVTLAPSTEPSKSSGLTFHYSPYAVGPYAEGSLTTFVPWTAFKDYLSPEGAALFGGTRPEGDDASDD